jgi:hypothetical protein
MTATLTVGARTEFGADFDQFLASYQVVLR